MIIRIEAKINDQDKIVFISDEEASNGFYNVHIDSKFQGKLFYRSRQWNLSTIDRIQLTQEDLHFLGEQVTRHFGVKSKENI